MTRSITCGTVLAVGLLCLTSLGRADDSGVLRSKPAAEYASHQSHGSVTVAAEPYEQSDKVQVAFGGAEPQVYGFLPVLLVDCPRDSFTMDKIRLGIQLAGPRLKHSKCFSRTVN